MTVFCPQPEELAGFLIGKLGQPRQTDISEHVDDCAHCQETVGHLQESTLSFRKRLRNRRVDGQIPAYVDDVISRIDSSLGVVIRRAANADPEPRRTRIGPYEIRSLLGRGGMGTVYKAVHTRLNREVAIKVLAESRMRDRNAIARFHREMEAVGPLDHPHVVKALYADDDDGIHYLAMELVEGVNLSRLLKATGPLDADDACELIRQAAVGLQYVHENGRVHRDIKPSNLMLCAEPPPSRSAVSSATPSTERHMRVKILDLGLALLQERAAGETSLTSAEDMMGTLDYMAPEQAASTRDVDIRADIYSLGATLYKLLSGQSPICGAADATKFAKLDVLLHRKLPSLARHRPDLPSELVRIVDRCLSREPSKRFATPAEVAEALAPFAAPENLAQLCDLGLASPEIEGASSVARVAPSPVSKPRAKGRVAIGVVLAGIALCSVIFGLVRGGQDSPREKNPTRLPPPQVEFAAVLQHHELSTHRAKLGTALAMDGDWAIVGAQDALGIHRRTGAAYVLRLDRAGTPEDASDDTWQVEARLAPEEDDQTTWIAQFGDAVAISAQQVLVAGRVDGPTGRGAGIAFLYGRAGDRWQLQQRLLAPNAHQASEYREAVAINGDYAAVTATDELGRSVVNVYVRNADGVFAHAETLTPIEPNARFGQSLAIDEARIAISTQIPGDAQRHDVGVDVFTRTKHGWTRQSLVAQKNLPFSQFHSNLAMEGELLLLGTPAGFAGDMRGAGAVHVYQLSGDHWGEQQVLVADAPTRDARFGQSVAIDDDHILVSARPDPHANPNGQVHVFQRSNSGWAQEQLLSDADHAGELFGYAIAASDGRAIVGVPQHSRDAMHEGGLRFLTKVDEDWQMHAPAWTTSGTRQAQNVAQALMGSDVVLGGDWLAVGASTADVGAYGGAGVVHVFEAHDSPSTTIASPSPHAHGAFGASLCAWHDFLVVGAPGAPNGGAVIVLNRVNDGWNLEQTLTGDSRSGGTLGASVAFSADWLVASVLPSEGGRLPQQAGVVNVYRKQSERWALAQSLTASDSTLGDMFGCSLALWGDTLLVGARAANGSPQASGAAYVFQQRENTWEQVQKLTAKDASPGAHFGGSVALMSDALAVGAPRHSVLGPSAGSTYVYRYDEDRWELQSQLFAPNAVLGESFGSSLVLEDNRLLVGAPGGGAGDATSGAAYLYTYDGATWQHQRSLAPPVSTYKQKFGSAVAMRSGRILIAAKGESAHAGAVYVFQAR